MYSQKVWVIGDSGAAGTELCEELSKCSQFELVTPPRELNHLVPADVFAVVLCLPDEAAEGWISSASVPDNVSVINAAYGSRFKPDWVYGYRLDPSVRSKVCALQGEGRIHIANPGCFATGMQLLLRPLLHLGALPTEVPLLMKGYTGFSAGGNRAIQAQSQHATVARLTNLLKTHGHVEEVKHVLGLSNPLMLQPTVLNILRGQRVELTLHVSQLSGTSKLLTAGEWVLRFKEYYREEYGVVVKEVDVKDLTLDQLPSRLTDLDTFLDREAIIWVSEVEGWLTFVAEYDNLGLGASGNIVKWLKWLSSNRAQ